MNRTQHISNNAVIGAPLGWSHAELPCSALPITRTVIEGVAVVQSFWRPDASELANLNAGGLIMLSVVGVNMPPVALDVSP